jgi:predicted O-linked N-acetylglucosamine transferase (SPINDLY family)
MVFKLNTYQECNKQGLQALEKNSTQEAINLFSRSVELENNFEACAYLAILYDGLSEYTLSIDYAKKALNFNGSVALMYKIMGTAFFNLKDYSKAAEAIISALNLDSQMPFCNYILSRIEFLYAKYTNASRFALNEIKVNASCAAAYKLLGDCYLHIGDTQNAIEYYKKGTRMAPDISSYDYLLLLMSHDPDITEQDIYDMTLEAYDTCLKPFVDKIPADFFTRKPPELNINKKLRIGLVSPNFVLRSAEMWAREVFKNLTEDFELYFYSLKPEESEDEATQTYFKAIADKWTNLSLVSDAAAAEIIREDQVDILVDLIGHVPGNRIKIFLYQAAPVQLTWLHYFATMGMPQIQYWIADNYTVPKSHEKYFTETVYKMPNYGIVFNQKPEFMDIECEIEIPFKKNGYISFGNFGRFHKTNPEVLQAWASILNQVANSKLILACQSCSDPEVKESLWQYFEKKGIARDRIVLEEYISTVELFLKKHYEVDMILDSFPFCGATTSFDATWMGVPIITQYSDKWVGRIIPRFLASISDNLVANSTEEYIANAVALANDPDKLQYYRHNLRAAMKNSPIYDSETFTKNITKIFRDIWNDHCDKASKG